MTESVASKLSTEMSTYLPKVHAKLNGFSNFKEKAESKLTRLEEWQKEALEESRKTGNTGYPVSEDRLKQIEFLVNHCKSEVDYQKKLFT